ncbi:hypothetical protein BC938DRAFT_478557 [Jimgerdemannia flammicorona]|uniref:Uncharacterized protein n=1 Tax=Jimgerdemannia flammicorona TaxID=994334 RepID=A0A433QMQ4_9FUNG|nr:hypothetical protein BC938DRAFT_478557 [Jimgerdemannia flammicorona]
MPHFPPEILSKIFSHIKATSQDPDLDLLAAAFVCTLWFAEAWPLVRQDPFQDRSLVLCYRSDKQLLRTSLLALSLQYGLVQCDHLESIEIHQELNYVRDRDVLHAMAAAIYQVVRHKPPGLRRVKIHPINYYQSYLNYYASPAEIIELLDVIFPPGEEATITELTIDSSNDVAVHLLERLGPTLRDVSIHGFQFDAPLLEALGRCSDLECLSASGGSIPRPGPRRAPPGAVATLAAALPNLTSLKVSVSNWDGSQRVSNDQLREIVTWLPDLKHLQVGVDFTVNTECLRFVMRHAKRMEEFKLVGCRNNLGDGVWTKDDVGWRGLRRIQLSGTLSISRSLLRLLHQECPKFNK